MYEESEAEKNSWLRKLFSSSQDWFGDFQERKGRSQGVTNFSFHLGVIITTYLGGVKFLIIS